MEQFIERLKANLKFLIIAAIALSTLHAGIGFCRHTPPVDVLLGFGFSVLVFFLVWGICNLNYIIQKHNGMIKIETVKKNNRFGIWIGLIAGIIAIIVANVPNNISYHPKLDVVFAIKHPNIKANEYFY